MRSERRDSELVAWSQAARTGLDGYWGEDEVKKNLRSEGGRVVGGEEGGLRGEVVR